MKGTNSSDWRIIINRQKGKTAEMVVPVNVAQEPELVKDGVAVSVFEKETDGLRSAGISMELRYEEPLVEHFELEFEVPVRVFVPFEKPEKITSIYMFGPWWTRPAFSDSFSEIPDKTQVALFEYPDRRGCLVPMVGDKFKAYLHGGTASDICIEMTALRGGLNKVDEPLYVYAEAPTVTEAVRKAFAYVLDSKDIPPRSGREIPEMFRYLGWCSWDAFYTDVSEQLLRQKADELIDKNVPVRWMLIDDGWFPSRDKMITGLAPDKAKFPEGFRPMIDDIRSKSYIKWFGVWHALGGYWGGIDPESDLANEEAKHLYRTANNCLIPDYRNGGGFYSDWCRLLKSQGIDFIKVDGQSTAPFYYANEVPIAEAARGMNRELESGSREMEGAIINCMGMAMENVLARPASAVSRNSDDFFPAREGSFTEHLLENAYNSIYHDEIYCCDWDMFWTKHESAEKHALLRAISGGPVYFSDRIGDTDPAVLAPLSLCDGSLLMMARSAKPTEDCVFIDPVKEGVLKLSNYAPLSSGLNTEEDGLIAGGIAAYNLSGKKQPLSFAVTDIPEISANSKYWVFDYFGKKASLVDADHTYSNELEVDRFAWYVIVPAGKNASCLGLIDKYTGFIAVESIRETENSLTVEIKASGKIGWLSCEKPSAVCVNGEDMTAKVETDGDLQYVALPDSMAGVTLQLTW